MTQRAHSKHSAPGAPLALSLRPEALRLCRDAQPSGPNSLAGRVVDSTYLGEIAQHAGHADIIRETIDGARSMG